MTQGSSNTTSALRVLTINSGSSSLKFALFRFDTSETLEFSGQLEGIRSSTGKLTAHSADGDILTEQSLTLPDHGVAFKAFHRWLEGEIDVGTLDAVGHRLVHGGPDATEPAKLTSELIGSLRTLIPLAPEHLPHELQIIESLAEALPTVRQIATFDTTFHRSMPSLAQLYPLPKSLRDEGVIRYGFHGLSYEYIVSKLQQDFGRAEAHRPMIIAHLGSGASMAAVKDGKSLETTMGFTPTGGLVMNSRTGDLDPGVMLYLLREKKMTAAELTKLVSHEGGLRAVSGTTLDMRALIEQEQRNTAAAEAVALFCYQARKHLGALATTLGGIECLVFTAGIGEHAPSIRARICQNLEFLGIRLDQRRNDTNAAIISADRSAVTVRVIPTNEELMIARHTAEVIRVAS